MSIMRGILLFIVFVFYTATQAQQHTKVVVEARQLVKVLTQQHLQPPRIDDTYSETLFNSFLSDLDPDRLYFTYGEIEQLSRFKHQLDNELNGDAAWSFLPALLATYKEALQRAERNIKTVCEKPVAVLRAQAKRPDETWAKSEEALTDRWRALVTIEVLVDLAKKANARKISDEGNLLQLEPVSRLEVRTNNIKVLRRKLAPSNGFETHTTSLFLKAVASVFDPHTVYFSINQMENFIASLSTEGYYLGIDFQTNDRGELSITGLLPGGPAWKSGQISNGDRVERIRWEGKDWIDITGMSEEEIAEALEGFNHQAIELFIRKPGGIERIVKLQKEKITAEENVARGFLLEGKKKIGYISVQDFYSDWGSAQGGRSANDVAIEILKMKKEKIEGLVLDLRFNSGGSMREALAMAGIFIDAGPLGIQEEKGRELVTLKDLSRGTAYDGPLVILMNGISASAAEFLAAAMQDHNRAIIVGNPSFGKAVAQKIFSLETGKVVSNYQQLGLKKQWGYATITTSRLYRVNGKSLQRRGVTPDIVVPDIYELYEIREKDMPFALSADSVDKKTYLNPLNAFPMSLLQEKSKQRIQSSEEFRDVETVISNVRNLESEDETLDWQGVKRNIALRQQQFAEVEKLLSYNVRSYEPKLHEFARPRMQLDEYAQVLSAGWIKNLSQDLILEEAYNVICDYIDTLQIK